MTNILINTYILLTILPNKFVISLLLDAMFNTKRCLKDKHAYVEWQTNYNSIIISLQMIIMINIDILGTFLPKKYVKSL